MTNEIKHALIIKASSQKVFNAITNPVLLNNWWTLRCEGKPKIKEQYRFYFTPEYDWKGIVTRVIDNRMFEIKMTESNIDWNPTSFGFYLEKDNNGTLLCFYHKNWASRNYHFQHTSYCWALLLKGLKDYVEKGIIVPFEKRA